MPGEIPPDVAAFCAAEHPRLVGAIALYTGDRHLAEEIAQETLLRACRRWEHVRDLESPGAWAWHVARNLARSHFRRQGVARRARQRLGHRGVRDHHDADVAGSVVVREAVASLPDRQKTALVLRHFLDWPVDDVAKAMGLSDDAVRSLTKRGVAALRETLTDKAPSVSVQESEDV